MNRSKKWLLYLIVLMVSAAFCLYHLFPADAVGQYLVSELNRAVPAVRVTADTVKLKPVFPLGLKLEGVGVNYLGKAAFYAETMVVRPDLLSLLSHTVNVSFAGAAAKGVFKGMARVPRAKGDGLLSVDVDLDRIRIEDIPAVYEFIRQDVAGSLNGQVTFTRANVGGTANGRAHLVLSDCTIQLQTPLIPLNSVAFNSIETDITIEAERLEIKRCDLRGNQLDADFTGSVVMMKPAGKSVLNLRGSMKPHPLLLAGIRIMFPVDSLSENRSGGEIPVRVRGTLDSPGVSFPRQ